MQPIPERKVVFTVKIPLSLVRALRQMAKSTGESLSVLVTRALEAFLQKKRRAWLTGFGESRSSCFIASIAWRRRNSLRSIGFWFLKAFNPGKEAERV
jgi:hypothetical protein